jgi:hypothetical protein
VTESQWLVVQKDAKAPAFHHEAEVSEPFHVRVHNLLVLLLNIVQANRKSNIIAVSYIVIFVFIMHINDGALDQNPHRDFGLDPDP